ncbi:hypothetical protein MTBBW1_90022 [Desulfamplus magnetovallimortis]|uniref:Uncharacterized protein n=1 Tax=Desulfamplus magnetovallimortis TaxID=1246637 RepID=A0A1W1HKX7_9BACT|nr:hypothetical protein MTBBW1_90022 [Desulfamplus magnetovallimortis]
MLKRKNIDSVGGNDLQFCKLNLGILHISIKILYTFFVGIPCKLEPGFRKCKVIMKHAQIWYDYGKHFP